MFNWPFSTRGATKKARDQLSATKPKPLRFEEFSFNGVYIKVALPDLLVNVIDTLSSRHESSRPDVVRATLFRHLYGSLAYDEFLEWKNSATRQNQAEETTGPLLSPRRGISMQTIGKSTSSIKYWIPERMKEDLHAVANRANCGVSVYVRMLLIRDFLGEAQYQSFSEDDLKPLPSELEKELAEE